MKAERETRRVPTTVMVDEEVIVLTITMDEATTLAAITMMIGGLPSGRRGHLDKLRVALEDVGINPSESLTKSGLFGSGLGFPDK